MLDRRQPRSIPLPKVDRISTLPNLVLGYILSFLPTKDVAATSVISKRWKPLWLSLLTLDFDDRTFPNFSYFCHVVSSVFLLRDPKLPIQSLRLKCGSGFYSGFDPRDIDIFVHSASQRGIENLRLEYAFKFRVDYRLPPSGSMYRDGRICRDDDGKDPETVPECLSSHLKICFLNDYEGTEYEFQFAKYIMLTAKVLHTIEIQSTRYSSLYAKLQMLKELSSCPRGSTTCELLFDFDF